MKQTITLLAAGLILAGSAKAQVANGDMELWRTFSAGGNQYEVPQSWYSIDSTVALYAPILGATAKKQVFKSTDKHGGTYAAMLVSHSYPGFGVVPGSIANAKLDVNPLAMSFTQSGGTAVTTRVSSASAWIKYIPNGAADSGSMLVAAVLVGRGAGGADSIVGSGEVMFNARQTYTQITANVAYINATVVPDHFQIGFTSSTFQAPGAADSSVLFVDDVTFSTASGVSRVLFNADVVKVYPNPASNVLYLNSGEAQQLVWEAIALNGRTVARKEFTKNATVPLNNLPAGTYFYRVANMNKEVVQTGKFVVGK